MTICVGVKIAEGVVLAADSASMLQGLVDTPQGQQIGILQTYEYANKVSRIKDYPIGVMSWGLGSIGARSIPSLIMEFEYTYAPQSSNTGYTVLKVADALLAFMRQRYDAAYPAGGPRPNLGMFVAGYSENHFFADEYTVDLSLGAGWGPVRPDQPDGSPAFGLDWYGLPDTLHRLIKGYDLGAVNELVIRGADQAIVQQWVDDAVGEIPILFDGMPLQDANDLAEYAVHVTIGRYRFAPGPPLC